MKAACYVTQDVSMSLKCMVSDLSSVTMSFSLFWLISFAFLFVLATFRNTEITDACIMHDRSLL